MKTNLRGRSFIKLLFLPGLISFFSWNLCASEGGDGKIRFFNYHLQEAQLIQYENHGRLLPEGIQALEKLFRSRDSGQTHPLNPRLIRLIDRIEDHFGVHQVELISGFRSGAFNRHLKETGHNVARESLHIQGMASDIHLDEISEEAIRDYALSLKQGGVGYYPNHNMVHVDVGEVRHWGEATPRNPWVGEKNDQVPVRLTVNPDRSFSKRLDRIQIDQGSASPVCLNPEMAVEFFVERGWKEVGAVLSIEEFNRMAKGLAFGKYRFRAETCRGAQIQYSNEFYLKRL